MRSVREGIAGGRSSLGSAATLTPRILEGLLGEIASDQKAETRGKLRGDSADGEERRMVRIEGGSTVTSAESN